MGYSTLLDKLTTLFTGKMVCSFFVSCPHKNCWELTYMYTRVGSSTENNKKIIETKKWFLSLFYNKKKKQKLRSFGSLNFLIQPFGVFRFCLFPNKTTKKGQTRFFVCFSLIILKKKRYSVFWLLFAAQHQEAFLET